MRKKKIKKRLEYNNKAKDISNKILQIHIKLLLKLDNHAGVAIKKVTIIISL